MANRTAVGVVQTFLNNKTKNAKNEKSKGGPKRILKKEEKDQLLKKLTPTQLRVTQGKITER